MYENVQKFKQNQRFIHSHLLYIKKTSPHTRTGPFLIHVFILLKYRNILSKCKSESKVFHIYTYKISDLVFPCSAEEAYFFQQVIPAFLPQKLADYFLIPRLIILHKSRLQTLFFS